VQFPAVGQETASRYDPSLALEKMVGVATPTAEDAATTVYEIDDVPVRPSLLFAVTVYAKVPAVVVLSAPGLVEPLLSRQDVMPGPPAPSGQVNAVGTDWPMTYVCPVAGDVIDAVGLGPGAVHEIVRF
jgi:hypothetical protein